MSDGNNNEGHVRVYRADLNTTAPTDQVRKPDCTVVRIEDEQREETENDNPSVSSITYEADSHPLERIIVNGPYSTCARYIFDCEHALLIGGGIGITPYASILSSLMAQFRQTRTICQHCCKVNYKEDSLWESNRLKKVDFIWVTPDWKCFEWFLDLLRQFEKEQEEYLKLRPNQRQFLNIKLYFTRINCNNGVDKVFLDHITNMWSQEMGSDIFTGLKSGTHFGRPEWDKLFQKLTSDDNSSKAQNITVFFCGPKTMGKVIKRHCDTFEIRYYAEKF